jgi:4-oxalocrotonate tautomerase
MPFVRIDWLPGRSLEQRRELARTLTDEICRVGRCTPESVSIVFVDIDREHWAASGQLLSDSHQTETRINPPSSGRDPESRAP